MREVFEAEVLGTWFMASTGVPAPHGTASQGLCALRASCVNRKLNLLCALQAKLTPEASLSLDRARNPLRGS